MEKNHELSVSAMMDRKTTKVPKSQIGFCQFVVLPLAQTITSALPGCQQLVDNVTRNLERWKQIELEEEEKEKEENNEDM
jgi:hypothetical protein